jgi:nucleotide-binding universal stress UspA family protein
MTYIREPTYEISFLFRKVLVPVDGSASSFRALDIAVDYAKRYGSKITILIVNDGSLNNVEKLAKKVKDKAISAGISPQVKTVKLDVTTSSTASKVVEEVIEGGYDLVILSARGKSANPDISIGSVALSVIINSPVSVLLIR